MTIEKSRISVLYNQATDYRNPLLTEVEIDELWSITNQAFHDTHRYQEAFMGAEALLCQADRGIVCKDSLPDPRLCPVGQTRSAGMIQGFVDRVESLNHYVSR